MNLNNIKKDMIINNYKELCKLLEIEARTGGMGRKNQIDWIEDYVKYKKDGHKFIIEDVYSDLEIVPMRGRGGDMSDNTHIEYIEKLILDMLVQNQDDGEIFLSKTKLFETLDMVNANYGYCSGQTLKVSKYMDIESLNVEEWFKSTSGMLERNLNKALNRLESQALIFWSKKITVKEVTPVIGHANVKSIVHKDSTGEETETFKAEIISSATNEQIREATKEEVQFVIHAEREVMQQMECENKQEVMAKGKWKEFQRRVKDILLKEINVGQYWQSYQIVFNHKHVKQGADKLNERLLPYEDRDEYKRLLNEAIQTNSNTNSINRNTNAKLKLKEVDTKNKKRLERRAEDTYIKDAIDLSHTMIQRNTVNMKRDIRAINPYENN